MPTNLQWQKAEQWLLGTGRGEGGRDYEGHRESYKVMDTFIILIAAVVSGVCAYVKNYEIEHFKYVQFIVCQLYLNKAV